MARTHLRNAELGDAVPTGNDDELYAGGWRITTEDDGSITHWHTGTVPGYFSAVYLNTATGDGVAMLMNASDYLHEAELAAITRSTYDRALEVEEHRAPTSYLASLIPFLFVFAALLIVLAGWLFRKEKWNSPVIWVVLAIVIGVVCALTPALMLGVPLRYLWLWEPSLPITVMILLASMLIAALLAWYGRRRAEH